MWSSQAVSTTHSVIGLVALVASTVVVGSMISVLVTIVSDLAVSVAAALV